MVGVLAGLVVPQCGLGPVASVVKAACADEHDSRAVACLTGCEAVLHRFFVADRFAEVPEGIVELHQFRQECASAKPRAGTSLTPDGFPLGTDMSPAGLTKPAYQSLV